jgi:hypothetical protein
MTGILPSEFPCNKFPGLIVSLLTCFARGNPVSKAYLLVGVLFLVRGLSLALDLCDLVGLGLCRLVLARGSSCKSNGSKVSRGSPSELDLQPHMGLQ